jgi:hypothetical protein
MFPKPEAAGVCVRGTPALLHAFCSLDVLPSLGGARECILPHISCSTHEVPDERSMEWRPWTERRKGFLRGS